MSTTSRNQDIRDALNSGNPAAIATALKKIKFGNMAGVIKVVAAGLTAAASFDITTAAFKALSTITGITLLTGENLPAIASVTALRVVASGTATSLGVYGIGDTGATAIIPPGGAGAAMGIAKISDDGKTLTFPNTITAFTLIYVPRADVALTTELPAGAPY